MKKPSRWAVLANLWIVYLVWGSTYLAIRVLVESMPPFLGAGLRFLIAGALLTGYLAVRDRSGLTGLGRREILAAGVVGVLLLGANGLVMTAEQTVPSGFAALLIGSVPLWVVLLRALDGQHIGRGMLASIGIGFVGVAILVAPHVTGGIATLGGPLILVAAAISWATGSFASQRVPLPRDPLVSTGIQTLIAGIVLSGVAVATGEVAGFEPSHVSQASLLALGYLVVFGSLVGFTAYTWLLHHAPVSTVATYAYVNPVIAVFLGWLVLGESITPSILAGALVIVASVAFLVRRESLTRPDATVERSTGERSGTGSLWSPIARFARAFGERYR